MDNKITGAEALTLALMAEGVDTVFGYPGGSNLPIYDSFLNHEEIKHILVRHEQGAVHAAEGYAEVSGRVGVCLATSGPGATNLITGIADAMLDSVPIVCITGQVNTDELGYDAFQETDVIGISMPVTKWNYQITTASEIFETIAKAFYIARSGRPGPVLIDITKSAQFETIRDVKYDKCQYVKSYHPKLKPEESAIDEAVSLLNNSRCPLLVIGHGVSQSGCEDEVMQLAQRLDSPVASTLLGLSAFPCENPLYAGMVGLHGNYAPNKMTNECDVLLAIGMRFDDRVTCNKFKYAPQAKIIHIEIDPAEINKIINVSVPIVSDAKSALSKILPRIRQASHLQWLHKMEEYKQKEADTVFARDLDCQSEPLRMGRVVRAVSDARPNGAITVTDVGQNQMASARYFDYKAGDYIVTSGGLGTMGFALPAAVGAAWLVQRENEKEHSLIKGKDVICIMGDGGFQMTMQELGTVMQYHLPVKMVLLNNNYLGMIRQLQDMYYNGNYYFHDAWTNPDFSMMVSAYGIPVRKVATQLQLDQAVKEMFATPGAFFIVADVLTEDNVYPVVPWGAGVDEMQLEPAK